jgi:hypothetical protein
MGYFVAVAYQRLTEKEIRSHVTSEPGFVGAARRRSVTQSVSRG